MFNLQEYLTDLTYISLFDVILWHILNPGSDGYITYRSLHYIHFVYQYNQHRRHEKADCNNKFCVYFHHVLKVCRVRIGSLKFVKTMDYFSKFLRANQPSPKAPTDHAQEFHRSWDLVKVRWVICRADYISILWSEHPSPSGWTPIIQGNQVYRCPSSPAITRGLFSLGIDKNGGGVRVTGTVWSVDWSLIAGRGTGACLEYLLKNGERISSRS